MIQRLLTTVMMWALLLWVVSSVLAAYSNDFQKAEGLSLDGAEMIRDFPPVGQVPSVRISWNKPDYYVVDGKPSGFGHFGQLERLPNGHLIACCQEQATGSHGADDPTRRTVCRVSIDGGYTWSDSRPVSTESGLHWGLCALDDGTIWLAPVVRKEGKRYIPRSTDEGKTWDFSMASEEGFFRFTIQMSNGEMLGLRTTSDETGRKCRGVVITNPEGSKWERIPLGAQAGYQCDECWITETGTPGQLYLLMRDQSQAHYYSQSWSDDYGRTWYGYSPSGVWFSTRPSRPHVTCLPDGTLVAVHAERAHGRIMAVPSFDNGKTWHRDASICVLDGHGGWLTGSHGYCDSALTDEGLLMASWYAGAKAEMDPECNGRGFYGGHIDPRYFKRPCNGIRLATTGDPEDARLIGRWSFEDEVSEVVYDSVNGNYGRAQHIGLTAGKVGGGILFNGTDSQIEVPDTPEGRVPNFFTIECFFRAGDVQRPQALISKRPYYYLGVADGKLNFQLGDPNNENMPTIRVEGETTLEAGRWYHALATTGVGYSGYRYMWLYLDGEQEVEVNPYHEGLNNDNLKAGNGSYYVDMRPDAGPMYYGYGLYDGYHTPHSKNLHLGVDNITGTDFFGGELDEISLYGRMMYPDEVVQMATRGYITEKPGVVSSDVITMDGPAWGNFRAETYTPEGTAITFAILDESGEKVLKDNVNPGDSLGDIKAIALRIEAKLSTSDPSVSPVLKLWGMAGTIDE